MKSREDFLKWVAKESDFGTDDWWNTVYDFLCGPSEAMSDAKSRNAIEWPSDYEMQEWAIARASASLHLLPSELLEAMDWLKQRLKGEKEG